MLGDPELQQALTVYITAEIADQLDVLGFLSTVNKKEKHTIRSVFSELVCEKITFHGQWDPNAKAWDPLVKVFDEKPIELDSPRCPW
jgi:hypothetical protein